MQRTNPLDRVIHHLLRSLRLTVVLGATAPAPRAAATTTLTVDLSATIRPVTHAASGSLYGVTEKLPADVNALIAPLHPAVFNNPATAGAGKQQPVGDAIVVAGRVASTGGKVSIRLADWLPGWPYTFTSMSDWLDKVSQTVTRKKASAVDNYYGYEIWNEPDGTWKSSMSFNDFWKQTYTKLRELDPSAKIIGPSYSYFNSGSLKSFLSYAKTNSCVPDIVAWHELSGGNLTSNFQTYRSIEQQVGVGPLPISINEYSGKDDLAVEGQPGASAPMIAKFERFQIDSACISYWDVAHAGRLGSLLATDTQTNGGWFFYKWYGDMTGNMVSTTPPSPNDAAALDGFANLDTTAGRASVLFGGVSDGTVQLVVKGFQAASVFGTTVHAVVEHTPFASRSTVVTATDTLSTADLTIANDQVTVNVTGANKTDGYRLVLTPVNGGSGGARDAGSTSGRDGGPGAIDAGRDAIAGNAGGAGGSGTISGAGGAPAPDARLPADATASGSGGLAATGGTSGSMASGGESGGRGGATSGAGGSRPDVGGAYGADGSGRGGEIAQGGSSAAKGTSSGCSCRLGSRRMPAGTLSLFVMASLLASRRFRRRRQRLAAENIVRMVLGTPGATPQGGSGSAGRGTRTPTFFNTRS